MTARSSLSGVLAVLVISLACAGLRLRGLDHGLPHQPDPDPYVVRQVEVLRAHARGEEVQPERQFYFYPLLMARLVKGLFAEPGPARPQGDQRPMRTDHLRAAAAPHLDVRRVATGASVAAVPLTWVLARGLLTPGGALIATGLTATSLLAHHAAGQAKPHALLHLTVLLALFACVCLRRRPTLLRYLLAGCAVGAAIGSLHSGAVTGAALLAAHLLRENKTRRERWAGLPVAALGIAALVLLTYPILEFRPEQAAEYDHLSVTAEDGAVRLLGHRFEYEKFVFREPTWMARVLFGWDPALAVGALLGVLALLAGSRRLERRSLADPRLRDLAVLAAYALPYVLALASYHSPRARYLLPLVPLLALLGAHGLTTLSHWMRARVRLRGSILSGALAVLLLGPALATSTRLAWLRSRPDTYEQTTAWVLRQAERDDALLVGPGFVPPIRVRGEGHQALLESWTRNPWLEYQSRHLRPGGWSVSLLTPTQDPQRLQRELDPARSDWILLEVSQRTRALGKSFKGLSKQLRARHRLVRRIKSGHDQTPSLAEYQDHGECPDLARRIWSADRQGPLVEIWKARDPSPGTSGEPPLEDEARQDK